MIRLIGSAQAARTAVPHAHLVRGREFPADQTTNVSPQILSLANAPLLHMPEHPIEILSSLIYSHLAQSAPFIAPQAPHPVVSTKANFDDLLIPQSHPGRSPSDTYYVNASSVLRTHTSAHQSMFLASHASDAYLITADVYRRDEIDPTHYPVFHQTEGIRLFSAADAHADGLALAASSPVMASNLKDLASSTTNPIQSCHSPETVLFLANNLRSTLESLIRSLLASEQNLQIRWTDTYFPFTSPSWELEVFYQGAWLELFGCGIIQQPILDASQNQSKVGWAFGLGLERIAMPLFHIPDIRLFWSKDPRFTSQFSAGKITKFVPFSKYPPCYKDISFWTPPTFHENDFMETVRNIAGDMVEQVSLIDQFTHPKTNRDSRCYRINYRSMERTLTNAEIDQIQEQVRSSVAQDLGVELR